MNFPSKIYAIYPLDEKGNISGVYVGMSYDIEGRFRNHMHDKSDSLQKEFHELMQSNGYVYQLFNDVLSFDDTHFEADWIAFFENAGVKTYNTAKKKGYVSGGRYKWVSKGGDISNLEKRVGRTRIIRPVWKGGGVVWQLEKLNTSLKMEPQPEP